MKLKQFMVGALTLLTLSSCGSKTSATQAENSRETPAITAQSTPEVAEQQAPDDEVASQFDGEYDENEGSYSEDGQAEYPPNVPQNSAQGRPADPNLILRVVQMGMQSCQQRLQMASTTYNMAQQNGDQAAMQKLEGQIGMHRQMYSQLEAASQNPQAYSDAQSAAALIGSIQEYDYRCTTGDQRPTSEIQPELAQFAAQAKWRASTPEGQAAFQAGLDSQARQQDAFTASMTAGHVARMNGIEASGNAHSARMNALQSQADARDSAWATNQRIGDERQQQTVHAINGEYEYTNPNDGQRYWVPGEAQNPTVINPDGTETELRQYYPSSNY